MCYSPPQVDRIRGIWGSYYIIPKAIFYLLKGDYRCLGDWGIHVHGLDCLADLRLRPGP